MEEIVVKIEKLDKRAKMPTYGTMDAACFDLYAIEDVIIPIGEIRTVKSGLAFEIPKGYEMQIRARSGWSFKHGIMVPNAPATIDADYRGQVITALINLGKEEFKLYRDDRYAQATIKEITRAKFEFVDKLSETKRGDGGFGHTGR